LGYRNQVLLYFIYKITYILIYLVNKYMIIYYNYLRYNEKLCCCNLYKINIDDIWIRHK